MPKSWLKNDPKMIQNPALGPPKSASKSKPQQKRAKIGSGGSPGSVQGAFQGLNWQPRGPPGVPTGSPNEHKISFLRVLKPACVARRPWKASREPLERKIDPKWSRIGSKLATKLVPHFYEIRRNLATVHPLPSRAFQNAEPPKRSVAELATRLGKDPNRFSVVYVLSCSFVMFSDDRSWLACPPAGLWPAGLLTLAGCWAAGWSAGLAGWLASCPAGHMELHMDLMEPL